MRAVEGLFDDNRPLHVVMAGPTDDVAFHVESSFLLRSNMNSGRLARLDRLVQVKCLDAETVLDVRCGDLQRCGLPLFEPDGIRLYAVSLHYNLDCDWLDRFEFT